MKGFRSYGRLLAALLCVFLFASCGGNNYIKQVKNGRMNFDQSTTIGKALSGYSYITAGKWSSSKDSQGRQLVSFTARAKDPYAIIFHTPKGDIDVKTRDDLFVNFIGFYGLSGSEAELKELGMDKNFLNTVYERYYEVYEYYDEKPHDEAFFVPASAVLELQWLILGKKEDGTRLNDQTLTVTFKLPQMDNKTLDVPIPIGLETMLKMIYGNKSYIETR
ncbi:hypothetical protein K7I13_03545 [Brucepastera parasyntrophica]|uniref:hypothetical protein n=1 Tax=Brucepastera parasyntrophica TaxID=2880008 RepID=UPI00210BEED5|nr:hypothetical protein [Brucepastera parasyntrophica]ULQ60394.1 hypothetical protein K7I13_03545 [Brucepastera parasyntrophica]